MRWSDIPFDPAQKTLRQFAGLWLVAFGAASAWQGLARGQFVLAALLAGVALVVGLIGLAWPRAVRALYVGGIVAGFPIGWAVSHLILGLLFFGIFTPVGLFFRLIGRDPLHRKLQPGAITYWETRPARPDPQTYFHQY